MRLRKEMRTFLSLVLAGTLALVGVSVETSVSKADEPVADAVTTEAPDVAAEGTETEDAEVTDTTAEDTTAESTTAEDAEMTDATEEDTTAEDATEEDAEMTDATEEDTIAIAEDATEEDVETVDDTVEATEETTDEPMAILIAPAPSKNACAAVTPASKSVKIKRGNSKTITFQLKNKDAGKETTDKISLGKISNENVTAKITNKTAKKVTVKVAVKKAAKKNTNVKVTLKVGKKSGTTTVKVK